MRWVRFPTVRAILLSIAAVVVLAAPVEAQPIPTATTDDAVEIMPPSEYAAWWFEVENCTGLRGDLREITFYSVPTDRTGLFNCRFYGARCLYGLYSPEEHAIYLSDSYLSERWLVAHEMLHALGYTGHPSPPFDVCAPSERPPPEPTPSNGRHP